MPEDHLAHYFKRNTAPACIGGSVASEIMRSQMYFYQVACLSYNIPGMLEELDAIAKDLNISRQAVIKTYLRQALDQHYIARQTQG